MKKPKVEYYTPDELLEKYPQLEDTLFWDIRAINMFYRYGLLVGKQNSNEKKPLIREDSFLRLVKLADLNKLMTMSNISIDSLGLTYDSFNKNHLIELFENINSKN